MWHGVFRNISNMSTSIAVSETTDGCGNVYELEWGRVHGSQNRATLSVREIVLAQTDTLRELTHGEGN